MVKYKRIYETSPCGGAYSEICFFDAVGNAADETEAVRCVIRECSADGSLLSEIWGECKRNGKLPVVSGSDSLIINPEDIIGQEQQEKQ